MQHRGFTLFELLIVLLVLTLLFSIGIPNFSAQVQSNRTRAGALDFLQSIHQTRTLAVTHRSRATLRHRGDWNQGWDLFLDTNNNGKLDESEVLITQSQRFNSVRVSANQPVKNYVSFIATGESRFVGSANSGAFQAGTFTVCPVASGAGYKLVLARSGRLRMSNIPEEECDAV